MKKVRKKFYPAWVLVIVLILSSGCGGVNNVAEQQDQTTEQKIKEESKIQEVNKQYMEHFYKICEDVVKYKVERCMKRNTSSPYDAETMEMECKNVLANYKDVLEKSKKQERMKMNVYGILSEQEKANILDVEKSIYHDLQYKVNTKSNNNIITVTLSMRCIDDKAMTDKIEKNFRERLKNTFPKQYKENMWLQNLVHTAWRIIPKTKERIEHLDNKKRGSNGKLKKEEESEIENLEEVLRKMNGSTDSVILTIFLEEVIKGYQQPIYLSDMQEINFHFMLKHERDAGGKLQDKIELINDDQFVDMNKMFWQGASSKNAFRLESIDVWFINQWPYGEKGKQIDF